MSTESDNEVLLGHLKSTRECLAKSLGHIPEVRKQIAKLDEAIANQAHKSLSGKGFVVAGIPFLEVTVSNGEAHIHTPHVLPETAVAMLVARLTTGITVKLSPE